MQQTEEKSKIEAVNAKAQSEPAKEASPELKEMFMAGVQYGYSRSKRNPKMAEYLFGVRNNAEIFDLDAVKFKLDRVLEMMRELGSKNGEILFVGTKPTIRDLVEDYAGRINASFVNKRWLGGTLTNFRIIRKRIDYFEDLRAKEKSGELEKYTKKERSEIGKELERLSRNFDGLVGMIKMPDALVIVDPKEESTAVREAKQKNIPIVAILNNDCNPDDADYPIPANDSSRSSVNYLLERIAKAYDEGRKSATKQENNEVKS